MSVLEKQPSMPSSSAIGPSLMMVIVDHLEDTCQPPNRKTVGGMVWARGSRGLEASPWFPGAGDRRQLQIRLQTGNGAPKTNKAVGTRKSHLIGSSPLLKAQLTIITS
ncbi:hypothetical protein Ocin01_15682 [Orchesella cincta]|uniref:Uncharacterized protein n=1 Tax=Orchesella cincta TaxID=48709 RepID=A0A1D2MDE3_ORCCI|nr:hypothetical protein Ocin01_15682 [Orchesella cincta]